MAIPSLPPATRLAAPGSDLLHIVPREKPFLAVQPAFPPARDIWEGGKKRTRSGVVLPWGTAGRSWAGREPGSTF